jgi:hypothetical protein
LDLDRLFSVGTGSSVVADAAFTNRSSAFPTFEDSLRTVRELSAQQPQQVTDLQMARRNVLSFYGMGGIGKTTLSKELQRRFDNGGLKTSENRISSRVDFAEAAAVDPELMLLRLRACLGQLTPRLIAFDFALASYWERKHPGESLANFIDRRSGIAKLSSDLGLADQIQSGVDSLLGGTGLVGSIWRAGSLLRAGVIKRVREQRLLEECPYFAPLIEESSPDAARPFLPALLAWDLAQYQQRVGGADVVIFFDTWEMLQGNRDELGSVEDTVNRIVYLMPNVLFVISGRQMLTWADSRRRIGLKYAGPEHWPELVPDRPQCRQYLLGHLSPEDSDNYLQRRLSVNGSAAIPLHVRARIVASSEGLPLYLDLSAEHYDQLLARGQAEQGVFGGTLPELVTRVIRDLTPTERHLLRAASLVRGFNADMLRTAVVDARDADIARFLARHFIKNDRSGWLENSFHDTLRASVREHDPVTGEAWSPREWRKAALAFLAYFEKELAEELRAGRIENRSRFIEAFIEGFSLAAEFDEGRDWLLEAGLVLRELGRWEVLRQLETLDTRPLSAAAGLVLASRAAFEREQGDLPEARILIDQALANEELSPYAKSRISLERAEILVRQNEDAHALPMLKKIISDEERLAERAGFWMAVIDERDCRFHAVNRWATSPKKDPRILRRAVDMQGLIAMAHGDFAACESALWRALDIARQAGAPSAEALQLEHLGWTVAWRDAQRAESIISEATELSDRLEIHIESARCRIAEALASVGEASLDSIREALGRCVERITATGYRSDALNAFLVGIFAGCVYEDADYAISQFRHLDNLARESDAHRNLVMVAQWWLDHASIEHPDLAGSWEPIDWISDESRVRSGWIGVLSARRS